MDKNIRLYAGTQHGLFVWRFTGSGWEETSRGFSDSILDSIAGCRKNPEQVFLGATHGGLYRTRDGGAHWSKVLDGDIRGVAVDPTDDRVVYTGTEPVHLYRSEDGGDSWEELSSLLDLPMEVKKFWRYPQPPHQGHIRDIFIQPENPSTIYLCIEHGGIVRSLDRGKTWEDVSGGIDYRDIHVILNLPHRLDRYYVATARGFFTAEDPTRGWLRAEKGLTRDYFHDFLFLRPAGADSKPTMLLATADKSPGYWRRESRGAKAAVFRSDDCAESWYRVGNGLPDNLDPMVWALTPHPHDSDSVFAGLGAVARGHASGPGDPGSILVTHDRGKNWEALPIELPADRVLYAAGD